MQSIARFLRKRGRGERGVRKEVAGMHMHTPLGGGWKVDGPGRSTCLVKSRRSASSHMRRLPPTPCRLAPCRAASRAGRGSGRRPHEGGAGEKAPARTLQHISSAIEGHRRACRHPLRTACHRVSVPPAGGGAMTSRGIWARAVALAAGGAGRLRGRGVLGDGLGALGLSDTACLASISENAFVTNVCHLTFRKSAFSIF